MNDASVNVPHGPEFFDQMRECRAAYERLGDAFARLLVPGWRVLDLGCGVGMQTARLQTRGYLVLGVDPCCTTPEPGLPFVNMDPLTLGAEWVLPPSDAVICTETAEHVYPERASRLVEVVTNCAGSRVIWSAARPGNEWPGHVNLQEPAYWLEKFMAHGFAEDVVLTRVLREAMLTTRAQHCGAVENFCVLGRVACP